MRDANAAVYLQGTTHHVFAVQKYSSRHSVGPMSSHISLGLICLLVFRSDLFTCYFNYSPHCSSLSRWAPAHIL